MNEEKYQVMKQLNSILTGNWQNKTRTVYNDNQVQYNIELQLAFSHTRHYIKDIFEHAVEHQLLNLISYEVKYGSSELLSCGINISFTWTEEGKSLIKLVRSINNL